MSANFSSYNSSIYKYDKNFQITYQINKKNNEIFVGFQLYLIEYKVAMNRNYTYLKFLLQNF